MPPGLMQTWPNTNTRILSNLQFRISQAEQAIKYTGLDLGHAHLPACEPIACNAGIQTGNNPWYVGQEHVVICRSQAIGIPTCCVDERDSEGQRVEILQMQAPKQSEGAPPS